MSDEIYKNAYKSTKTITVDGATLTWSVGRELNGAGSFPMLCSNITIQYARSVTPLSPVNGVQGEAALVEMVGRPMGQLSIVGIATISNSAMQSFLDYAGRACIKPGEELNITLRPYSDQDCVSEMGYRLKGVIGTSMGVSIQGGGQGIAMITKPMTFNFTSMEPIKPI